LSPPGAAGRDGDLFRFGPPSGRSGEPLYTYTSPDGLFELSYTTVGPDSVPPEDVDPPNGIPDYVERCAEYADFSWHAIVDSLGFTAPELPPDGTYDIGFMNWPPLTYGVAYVSGATTRIVIHSNFAGPLWGSNDDPDGPALGRAKVTIAHELKHASQFTNNGWTEASWAELDAAWVEDIVYPATNDYLKFIDNLSRSQLDAPWIPMDDDSASSGNYEDCLWQHHLSQEYGPGLLVDLWAARAANPWEDMHVSYENAMGSVSTGWIDSYPRYLEECWFTGPRADPSIGFPDAAQMWTMETREPTVNTYPFVRTDTIERLSGHPRRFNKGQASGHPRITFDGEDGVEGLTVSVIVRVPGGAFTIVRPPLDAENRAEYVVPVAFPDLNYVVILVTQGSYSCAPSDYQLEVEDDTAVGAPLPVGVAGGLSLEAPHPNPASAGTRFAWSQPAPGAVSVRVVDVRGRNVRRFPTQARPAGRHELAWDGRDEAGRRVADGIYWVRLSFGDTSAARPVTVLRR
jgi:hypothetical protein